jgi:hypothetical protein
VKFGLTADPVGSTFVNGIYTWTIAAGHTANLVLKRGSGLLATECGYIKITTTPSIGFFVQDIYTNNFCGPSDQVAIHIPYNEILSTVITITNNQLVPVIVTLEPDIRFPSVQPTLWRELN